MAYAKKDVNAKYDKLRKQLKDGTISKEAFKAAAMKMHKMYHSDSNKNQRRKDSIKVTPPRSSSSSSSTPTRTRGNGTNGSYMSTKPPVGSGRSPSTTKRSSGPSTPTTTRRGGGSRVTGSNQQKAPSGPSSGSDSTRNSRRGTGLRSRSRPATPRARQTAADRRRNRRSS